MGVVLTVLPMLLPKQKHLIPSPAGVGLAWTFHWYYGFLMFVGGGLGLLLEKTGAEVVGGVHVPGRVGLDRRREPDGRGRSPSGRTGPNW